MRILQIAYKSKISGGEKVLFDLAVCLRRRGHQVLTACPDPGQLPERLAAEEILTKVIPFHKTYDLPAALRLARLIREERIEIVHSHGMLTNILARLAGRRARVPVSVSTEHLTMELARGGRGKNRRDRIQAAYYRRLDNFTSRYNQVVIAVSKAVRDDLLEQGMDPGRVIVIQNGIEIPPLHNLAGRRIREELGITQDIPVIGTVGRLSPQKDYPTFLRAAAEVIAAVPRALFLILGDGDLRPGLEKLAAELKIAGRVRFLGYRENVLEMVSAFDIFALSSLWEGLPLAVLEAMALAKSVVATAVPGTAEALVDGETGFAVPIGDPAALAGKIIHLAGNPGKAREMGKAGRKRAEDKFSRKRMADEHEELYQRLLNRHYQEKQ